jgi:hypothetical protein
MILRQKNKLNIIALALLSVFTFSGCVEKDPIRASAQVLFVPLSPNSTPVDFLVNDNRVGTTFNYSSTVGTVRYTIPYFIFEPKATNTFAYNFTGGNIVAGSVSQAVNDEEAYSTFLIDSIGKAKVAIVKDDLTEATPGKIKIRFFHFSPNTVPMDVTIQGATSKLFVNRSFNDQATTASHQNFIEIDPGTYTFVFTNATTNAVLYTTTSQILLTDRIYTLAARGFTGGAGNQALGAWLYPNKP